MAPSTAGTVTAPVMLAGTAILGNLTIAGREQNASRARSFVESVLGKHHPSADVAKLLVSELFTNAVQHSESRRPGGTVSLIVTGRPGSIGIEVIDQGSMWSVPVVKADVFATSGRGLFLVQSLADEWGYLRDSTGTTVWFRVATPRGS
jgi:anti-sigma regulatory factor (Ser/Thr protein kinase)